MIKTMEEIKYRNTKLLVQTIPKGTLLFRLVNRPTDDTRGVPIDDETRCIIPNFNVFFYPNPFIMPLALGKWIKEFEKDIMYAYILVRDVKVLRLLDPSKYSRSHKTTKRNFIKLCSTVKKGCMPKTLNYYDPCLSDTIIKKYPDIVGMLALSRGDSRRLKTAIKKRGTAKVLKYFHNAKDSEGVDGPPELVLYPLSERLDKELLVKKTDKLQNNFKILTSFPVSQESQWINFMNKHAKYDPETFFYAYTP